jgi:hypothetical protein
MWPTPAQPHNRPQPKDNTARLSGLCQPRCSQSLTLCTFEVMRSVSNYDFLSAANSGPGRNTLCAFAQTRLSWQTGQPFDNSALVGSSEMCACARR